MQASADPDERYRSQFEVTRTLTYLNHAAAGPMSRTVVTAIERFLGDMAARGSDASDDWVARSETTRRKVARFLGATEDEIAFMKNTPDGINAISNGIRWREGDNVITLDIEFPANVYPWMNLRDRGVECRILRTENGCIDASDIIEAIDRRTRVVALSWVEFHGGLRHDLAAIGRACREAGVYLAVDAVQGAGSLVCDVEALNIDFLCAAGHKWMLGPNGIAMLYEIGRAHV